MTLREYPNIQQGEPEWHDLRRGVVTASVVGKLLAYRSLTAIDFDCPDCGARANGPCLSKMKPGVEIKTLHPVRAAEAERADVPPVLEVADNDTSRALTTTLVAERIAGWTEDSPMTSDMWRGVESEPIARDIYSGHYQQATETGFMLLEEDGWSLGYSPDGLVGTDGLIEIKAPRAKAHLNTILANEVPAYYMPQLQAGLLVSGRKWIDFVSYCGGLPLWVKRVTPDPAWFDAITAACQQFEKAATEMGAAYIQAIVGLPQTERIDFNRVELKLA